MNLETLVNRAKMLSMEELLLDRDWERPAQARTVLAASRAAHALGQPYAHPWKGGFEQTHKRNVARSGYNLAHWEEMHVSVTLPRPERILIAGWHFAEFPTLFASLMRLRALVLVPKVPPWFRALEASGCTLNTYEPGAAGRLAAEMIAGRVIVALLDEPCPGTPSVPSRLLGRVVDTPSPALELCARYRYTMVFPAMRRDRLEIVRELDATGRSAAELAQAFNDWLEQELRLSPEAWLMWPSLSLR